VIGERVFFVTFVTHQRCPLFRNAQRSQLMCDVLACQVQLGRMVMHAYVLMPDHVHLVIEPSVDVSVEKAVQFIRGGFSFRVKRECGWKGLVWQEGFTKQRARDFDEMRGFVRYVNENPVRGRLVMKAEDYAWSSAGAEPRMKRAGNSALKGRSFTKGNGPARVIRGRMFA